MLSSVVEAGKARRLLLIINPRAGIGSALHLRERIMRELDGLDVEVHVLGPGEDARAVTREALERGATDIIAAGGDGTVSGVAGAMVGKDASLGIIPAGTANMLARELGLPISVSSAARVIAEKRRTIGIDALDAGERSYVYQVVLGSTSDAVASVSRDEKMMFGRTACAIAGLKLLADYHPIKVRGSIDGREFRMWAHQVIIVNAGILGIEQLRWGPNIRPDDGTIDVIALRGRTRLGLLSSGIDLMIGNYSGSRSLRYFKAKREIVIETTPVSTVKADGEMVGRTPLRIAVRPKAVKVIVPGDSSRTA